MGILGKDLIDDIAKMSIEIGLPTSFLPDLQKQEDWSFVIKTHAFLEGLVSHAIAETVHRKELSEILCRLEMGNIQSGKVRIAEKLGLIKADGKRFLMKLTSLRNDLAHDVQQVNFKFSPFLQSLDKKQRKEFIKSFSYFASEDDMRDHYDLVIDLVVNHTKHAIWLSTMHFTAIMWWKKENEKLKTLLQAMRKDLVKMETS
jgi:hypothetical protein